MNDELIDKFILLAKLLEVLELKLPLHRNVIIRQMPEILLIFKEFNTLQYFYSYKNDTKSSQIIIVKHNKIGFVVQVRTKT